MSGAEGIKAPRAAKILGTSVNCVDYEDALKVTLALARGGRPAAVSACNTHLIALARTEPDFHQVMEDFDLVVPDGFPLVWKLNAQGAKLRDRVYGPYLMRFVLERT